MIKKNCQIKCRKFKSSDFFQI